jgi:nicotinamide-nucleotide amidase
MRCEVLAVGTELLLGQIVDTNSSWIGEQLAAHGIDSMLQTKVGDNLDRIVTAMRASLERADALIVCGGLGPTHDDLTRDAIAAVMGVDLEFHSDVADVIRGLFAARNRVMPENNLRQAMVPVGAEVIAQRRGTAPGLVCPIGDRVLYAVPGVPHEMREMIERAVLPDLVRRGGDAAVIVSRTLRTWGLSESGLNERLDALIGELDRRGDVTLAFLASGIEGLKVRLTTKAPTEAGARARLAEVEAQLRTELGSLIFGVDGQTMESVVLDALRSAGLTIGVAESVTGGWVAARLTEVPGASDVVRGSVVSYSTDVKRTLLGVEADIVVSEAAAIEMALGARRTLGADVGLSLTGVAGPSEQDGQPVGTVFVGLAWPRLDGSIESEVVRLSLPGQRDQIRQFAVISALDALRHRLAVRSR